MVSLAFSTLSGGDLLGLSRQSSSFVLLLLPFRGGPLGLPRLPSKPARLVALVFSFLVAETCLAFGAVWTVEISTTQNMTLILDFQELTFLNELVRKG